VWPIPVTHARQVHSLKSRLAQVVVCGQLRLLTFGLRSFGTYNFGLWCFISMVCGGLWSSGRPYLTSVEVSWVWSVWFAVLTTWLSGCFQSTARRRSKARSGITNHRKVFGCFRCCFWQFSVSLVWLVSGNSLIFWLAVFGCFRSFSVFSTTRYEHRIYTFYSL